MNHPLRIVVTRPAGQAQGLCDRLSSAGLDAIAIPVIEIRPAEQPDQVLALLTDIDAVDVMIFVSTNAVRYALDYLPAEQLNAKPGRRIAAVGPSTARALEEAGLPCDVVPRSGFSSEALLAEDGLQDVQDKNILIFRGDGGRPLLGDTLTERGARVRYIEVYRRQVPQSSAAALKAQLDTPGVDLITATSVETLVNIEQMAGAERSHLLHNVKVVTASERVLKKAGELGYTRNVLLANAPDDAALVAAVVDWQRNARTHDPAPETESMATDHNATDQEQRDEDVADASTPVDNEPVAHADVDVEPEVVAPPPVATQAPAKGGRSVAMLALLVALLAAALSAFSAWKSLNPVVAEIEDPGIALEQVASSLRSDVQSNLDTGLASVRSANEEAKRAADTLRRDVERKLSSIDLSELDTISEEQAKLNRRISGQERSISTVTSRLQGIESDMSAMQGVSDSVRSTWIRAEAEYFLQTANSRLQLAGDVASALEALRAADDRIGTLGDPGLIPVRAKITEEILAVESVPRPDVEGMALTLIGMVERVPALPLELEDVPTRYESGERPTLDDKSGFERLGASVAGAFSDIVRIRPSDSSELAVLPPEDTFFIVRNLELHLNVARLALMRQEGDNFKASIKAAREWLALYYDTSDAGVQSMVTRLEDLEQTVIDPTIPDISASLRMLRTLVAASSTSN